jgi:hypothetical protein
MSQQQTIINFLNKGRKLSTNMAKSWGISNPSARISELRAQGHMIYTNRRKNGTHYRVGKPTRQIIRLAWTNGGQLVLSGR